MIARHIITTTLTRIRKHSPCESSWRKLLAGLGKTKADDEALPYSRIVEICGIDGALWATRAEPQHARVWRHFACACAWRVAYLSDDPRVKAAIETAERHADGNATGEELSAARDAAWAAAEAAAWAAAQAAWAAADAAEAEAGAAAWAAAEAAAGAAAGAAWAAEREWQRKTFLNIVGGAA